jgi:large subunit ribosomal protein L29
MSKKKEIQKVQKTADSLTGQTVEKLNEQLVLFKKELFNLRFQKKMGELKNTSRFAIVRKEVARLKTELVKRSKLGDK